MTIPAGTARRRGLLGITVVIVAVLFVPAAYGHGLGLDTAPPFTIDGEQLSVTVEIPSYAESHDRRTVTVTAADGQGEPVRDVTYLIGLYRGEQMLFRNYFQGGERLSMDLVAADGETTIRGEQEPSLGAWRAEPGSQLEVAGSAFAQGGLYTFEIEVRAIGGPQGVVEGLGTRTADVTVVDESEFVRPAGDGQVEFTTRSYFDSVQQLEYDHESGTVTFDMPFDWAAEQISHVPVVHVEVRFPKDFARLASPGYSGSLNGVELFNSSVIVDDYTSESQRIVHFVLLQEHVRFVKNNGGGQDGMQFLLVPVDEASFPVMAWTRDESLRVDLSWDPPEIVPGQQTRFVFTIRDGATAEPLRDSSYDFVVSQGGQELYRQSGNARVGGDYADYTFPEDGGGPAVIRFENLRGTGQATEFGVVVAPEFGLAALVLALAAAPAVLLRFRPARL